MLGIIGVEVGERWEEWRDKLHYFDYVVIVGLLALGVWALIRWRRGGPGEDKVAKHDGHDAAPAESEA
jgi:hypothetical protein